MSEILNELEVICNDCLKLKRSIYKNEIIFKATKEQESAFYRMLDSIINRLEAYMNQYKDMNHVYSTESFIFQVEEKNKSKGISYEFPKMRNNLMNYYKEFIDIHDEDTNFVAVADAAILAPLRLISEKLYLELTKKHFDESLQIKLNQYK